MRLRAGISIGVDDMVVPGEKAELVKNAEKEVVAVESQYQDGAITHGVKGATTRSSKYGRV